MQRKNNYIQMQREIDIQFKISEKRHYQIKKTKMKKFLSLYNEGFDKTKANWKYPHSVTQIKKMLKDEILRFISNPCKIQENLDSYLKKIGEIAGYNHFNPCFVESVLINQKIHNSFFEKLDFIMENEEISKGILLGFIISLGSLTTRKYFKKHEDKFFELLIFKKNDCGLYFTGLFMISIEGLVNLYSKFPTRYIPRVSWSLLMIISEINFDLKKKQCEELEKITEWKNCSLRTKLTWWGSFKNFENLISLELVDKLIKNTPEALFNERPDLVLNTYINLFRCFLITYNYKSFSTNRFLLLILKGILNKSGDSLNQELRDILKDEQEIVKLRSKFSSNLVNLIAFSHLLAIGDQNLKEIFMEKIARPLVFDKVLGIIQKISRKIAINKYEATLFIQYIYIDDFLFFNQQKQFKDLLENIDLEFLEEALTNIGDHNLEEEFIKLNIKERLNICQVSRSANRDTTVQKIREPTINRSIELISEIYLGKKERVSELNKLYYSSINDDIMNVYVLFNPSKRTFLTIGTKEIWYDDNRFEDGYYQKKLDNFDLDHPEKILIRAVPKKKPKFLNRIFQFPIMIEESNSSNFNTEVQISVQNTRFMLIINKRCYPYYFSVSKGDKLLSDHFAYLKPSRTGWEIYGDQNLGIGLNLKNLENCYLNSKHDFINIPLNERKNKKLLIANKVNDTEAEIKWYFSIIDVHTKKRVQSTSYISDVDYSSFEEFEEENGMFRDGNQYAVMYENYRKSFAVAGENKHIYIFFGKIIDGTTKKRKMQILDFTNRKIYESQELNESPYLSAGN